MKIFIDTSDRAVIAQWKKTGLIDGVTTNPSNLSGAGGDPIENIHALCTLLVNGEINVEVTEKDADKIYLQAKKIASIAPNIVVKIPCHRDYYGIIKKLVEEGIPINVTLVFTLIQGILMSKLGVRYISPFIGRWDDLDVDASSLLAELRMVIDQYGYSTQILAASLRTVQHVHEAFLACVDVITVPASILEKITTHTLTDAGIMRFDADWQKLNRIHFP